MKVHMRRYDVVNIKIHVRPHEVIYVKMHVKRGDVYRILEVTYETSWVIYVGHESVQQYI